MENVIHCLTLELSAKQYEVVQIKQYDINSRELIIKLVNNGTPYFVDTSTSARIKYEKSDGTTGLEDCTILEDGTIKVIISEQMTACEGINNCELLFNTTDKVLHSMNFGMNIRESVFSDDEITSSNEYIALENALMKVDNANEIVDEALEGVDEAVASINKLESTIKVSENARVSAENTRKSAENTRIANENQRITEFEKMKEIVAEADSVFDIASGTSILLQNSIDDELVDFKMYGGSSQNSYSGKNLLENDATSQTVGGLTFTVNNDGSIKVSGATTGANNLQIKTLTLAAGTYVLSGMENVSGSGDMVMRVYDATNSKIITDLNKGSTQITFTLSSETTLSIYINFNTVGITYSGTIYPMISVEGGEYESYVGAQPSPNPSYTQPIKSKGDNGYNDGEYLQGRYDGTGAYISSSNYIYNKNLIPCNAGDVVKFAYETTLGQIIIGFYDKDKNFISSSYNLSQSEYEVTAPTNAAYFYWNANLSGITPSNAKKIVVTINGTYAVKVKSVNKNLVGMSSLFWSANDNSRIIIDNVYLKPNTYILSWTQDKTLTSATRNTAVYNKRGDTTEIYQSTSANNNLKANRYSWLITITEEAEYTIKYWINAPSDDVSISNIQLEIGDTMTDYEEHKEHTEWIPLSKPLRGIGEVKDSVKAVDGLYGEGRKIYKVVFDGNEAWNIPSTSYSVNTTFFAFNTTDIPLGINNVILSSHLVAKDYDSIWTSDKVGIGTKTVIANGNINFRVRVSKEIATTVAEWKAWLAENPIEVEYVMAEEVFTPFADQTPFRNIQTYNSTTYITATDDPQMEVKYYKNSIDGTCVHDVIEYTASVLDNKIDSVNSDMLKKTSKLDNKMDILKDEFDSQFKTPTGSPVLAQGSEDGYVVNFTGVGGSEQAGEPTTDAPIVIKSKGDSGWNDGEYLQGRYSGTGVYASTSNYICNKNLIPCKEGDKIKFTYEEALGQIIIGFYDADMNFISTSYNLSSAEYEVIVPTNARYAFWNANLSGITPLNAKKIIVTINNMYALIVKNKGKNQLENINLTAETTKTGVTCTPDLDGSFTLNGTSTGWTFFNINYRDGKTFSNGSYKLLGSNNKAKLQVSINKVNTTASGNAVTFSVDDTTEQCHVRIYISGENVTFNNETIYPMVIPADITDESFEPYKEVATYIPIKEPLRGIGEVTDTIKATDGLYRGHRKFKEVVFDGSDDETLGATSGIAWISLDNLGNSALCTHFTYNAVNAYDNTTASSKLANGQFCIRQTTSDRIYFKLDSVTNLDEWKAWLNEKPITVLYELAEGEIEELDQTPFYRLKTFEGVTYITASDDMEMEIEVPTSRAGGVASIGWSKGNLAQIETQKLNEKIAELQTAIVNM